jgi:hypothetical protein
MWIVGGEDYYYYYYYYVVPLNFEGIFWVF